VYKGVPAPGTGKNPGSKPATGLAFHTVGSPGGGGAPYSGQYGEAPPERGAFFKLAVYQRVGKIAILVYKRVTKSVAKWKK